MKAVVSDRDPGAAFRGFAGAGVGRPPPQPVIHPKKQKSFLGDPGQEAGATQERGTIENSLLWNSGGGSIIKTGQA